jgi:hypothetical protein
MNQDDLEPLSEDLKHFLQRGRPGEEPPPAAREAVLSFVAASASAAIAGGARLGAQGTGHVASGASRAKHGAWHALKGSFGIGGILVGAAVGGAIGAGGRVAWVVRDASSPVQASPTMPASAPVTAANSEPHAPPLTPRAPAPASSADPALADQEARPRDPSQKMAAAPAETASTATTKDTSLGEERALIDMARTAVARGQWDAALATIERHAHEFPKGRMWEEREWLRIQALLAAGRNDEARQRAASFRKTFPHSFLLPALDKLMPSLPPPNPPPR